MGENSGQ
jgi:hypothetical protein